jgi:deoxyribonuclease-4
MSLIGAHISAQGGVDKAPANALAAGCECFQFFSRPPQGGPAPKLTPAIIKKFKQYKLESYIHTPYYINLASLNNRIKYGSIKVIREELERASLLGVRFVMTHLGSAKGYKKRDLAIKEAIKSISKILDGYRGRAMFLIENSAGSGEIIGHNFKEIKKIINSLKKYKIGVCLDVMHAFASGYQVETLIDRFDKEIGLKYLKLIHANDSKVECGSHVDRHEQIGQGKIGADNFSKLLHDKRFKKINFILETPGGRQDDIAVLKQLRSA